MKSPDDYKNDEFNKFSEDVLLIFHYKQGGWHGAEVLRYDTLQEAKDDLRIVARYGVDSNKLSLEDGSFKLYNDYMKNVEHSSSARFSLEGNRESFQAEIVPFKKVAADKEDIDKLSIIHFNGSGYDFSNKLYNDFNIAKKDFFNIADKSIDDEVRKGVLSKHDASITRITLDEYKKIGKYKWGFIENGNFRSFSLHQYNIKDLRKDKVKFLDGQNRSIFLDIIDTYQKGERFFMTDMERRYAMDDEKFINGSVRNKKINEVFKIHHQIHERDYDVRDTEEVSSFAEAVALMRKKLYEDLEKYGCSKKQRDDTLYSFIMSMENRPVRYMFKIPADDTHGVITVSSILEEGRTIKDDKFMEQSKKPKKIIIDFPDGKGQRKLTR